MDLSCIFKLLHKTGHGCLWMVLDGFLPLVAKEMTKVGFGLLKRFRYRVQRSHEKPLLGTLPTFSKPRA